MTRKRPCSFCGSWFQPDLRVGDRQYACSNPKCQKKRRRRKQAKWRHDNPDYFVGRRWTGRVGGVPASASGESAPASPKPVRSPPPLEKVPWDVVQSQIGDKASVMLGLFARLLLRVSAIPVVTGSLGNHRGNSGSPPTGVAIPDGPVGAPVAPSGPPNECQPPRSD